MCHAVLPCGAALLPGLAAAALLWHGMDAALLCHAAL